MADITPVDYSINVMNPTQALMQGLQVGSAISDQQQKIKAEQVAQQQAQQYQQDVSALVNNPAPTAQDYANFTIKHPQAYQAVKAAADQSDQAQKDQNIGLISRTASALQAGDTDTATQIMQGHVDALKAGGAAPQTIQAAQTQADLVRDHPDFAKTHFNLMSAALLGADKYAANMSTLDANTRANQLQPAAVQDAGAKADIATAQASVAPAAAQQSLRKNEADIANTRSETSNRAAQYNLDVQKAQNDFDVKLQDLQSKNGKLEAGMASKQADAVGSSVTAAGLADQASGLASQIRANPPVSGVAGTVAKGWGILSGDTNVLRQQFTALKNQAALGMLPPGSASDTDVKRIDAGFPSDTASAETIAQWLDSFSRVQKAVALREEARADWISQNGDLGNARRDINVAGSRVPAGATFTYFVKNQLKPQDATPSTTAVPIVNGKPAPYLTKYGS